MALLARTDSSNNAWAAGFRLHGIFEQNGNTAMVSERRG
jgi:hypothetical protein